MRGETAERERERERERSGYIDFGYAAGLN